MSRIFAILGKLLLGAIFLVAILTAGYHIGISKNAKNLSTLSSPQVDTKIDAIVSPSDAPLATPTPQPQRIRIDGNEVPYSISVPTDWMIIQKTDASNNVDQLTLKKDNYLISIQQSPTNPVTCLFPNTKEEENSEKLDSFTPIKFSKLHLARGERQIIATAKHKAYLICEKSQDSYKSATSFGQITYETPESPDGKILEEMDSMIASLSKQ